MMDEQSTRFICITYQGKQNGSVVMDDVWSSWIQHKFSPYKRISPKIILNLNALMKKQSKCLFIQRSIMAPFKV